MTRHTRQGCARGQRHGTLDRDSTSGESGAQPWAATSHTAMAAKAPPWEPPSRHLPLVAGPGCWCGAERGHDWPGKGDGAPHPRDPETWQDAARRLPSGRS